MMKVPTEIRQMWTDSYNLLVEVYKDEDALNQPAEQFFGNLLGKMKAESDKHHHPIRQNGCGRRNTMQLREAATIIRASLTMEQVVSVYLPAEPVRRGFIACPFHGETVGSLKIYDDTFYCFGCHAGGDALDFVGKLLNCSPDAAIRRINDDFQLGLPVGDSTMAQRIDARRRSAELIKRREDAQKERRRLQETYSNLMDEWTSLAVQMRDNAPTDRDAP